MEIDTNASTNIQMETEEGTQSQQKKIKGEELQMEEEWDSTKPTYTAL